MKTLQEKTSFSLEEIFEPTFSEKEKRDVSLEEIIELFIGRVKKTSPLERIALVFFNKDGFNAGVIEFDYYPIQEHWVVSPVDQDLSIPDKQIFSKIMDLSREFGDPEKTIITIIRI
jgi:hypothetical protein